MVRENSEVRRQVRQGRGSLREGEGGSRLLKEASEVPDLLYGRGEQWKGLDGREGVRLTYRDEGLKGVVKRVWSQCREWSGTRYNMFLSTLLTQGSILHSTPHRSWNRPTPERSTPSRDMVEDNHILLFRFPSRVLTNTYRSSRPCCHGPKYE